MSNTALVEGFSITHRRYVPYSHAHYGGNLVDGAYGLGLFGDVATELCIHTDGDEGLFAGYQSVDFLAPIHAGDIIEATATLTKIGTRSRTLTFQAQVTCRSTPDLGPSSAAVLNPPIIVTQAIGTVVVPNQT